MVDNFSILLSHILLALAFWFLTMRDDLDREDPPMPDPEPETFAKKRNKIGGVAAITPQSQEEGHPHA